MIRTLLSKEFEALSGGSGQSTIYVDGFSGGKIPPKNMIREIRINQNAYSAKNDTDPIGGFVEIFTKPGTDKLHGEFFAYGNDSALNAKNPFYPNQPAYDSYSLQGNVSGPLTKRSSYFLNGGQFVDDTNSTISAVVLNADLNQVPFSPGIASEDRIPYFSIRGSTCRSSKNDTLSFRYEFSRFDPEQWGRRRHQSGEPGVRQ